MEKKNLLEDKFMTSAKFSQEVEKIAVTNENMTYIESYVFSWPLFSSSK